VRLAALDLMTARLDTMLLLVEQFAVLSLMAVGGANILLPEMHQFAVERHHWMTHREFGELFALAQAAPGPNVLFVALIGWKAAGIPGACAAITAICVPSSAITLVVARFLERFRDARWRIALQKALSPVTAGLMIAAAILLMRPGEQGSYGWILSLMVVAGSLRFRLNPLWYIALGALAGATVF
jgi:chromate transporter